MMGLLLLALLVIVVFAIFIGMTLSLLGLILHLLVAGFVGWLADLIVPGRIPFGWIGAIAAGLVGSWLGALILGRIGPTIFGVPLVSALVGAIILALAFDLLGKLMIKRRLHRL